MTKLISIQQTLTPEMMKTFYFGFDNLFPLACGGAISSKLLFFLQWKVGPAANVFNGKRRVIEFVTWPPVGGNQVVEPIKSNWIRNMY